MRTTLWCLDFHILSSTPYECRARPRPPAPHTVRPPAPGSAPRPAPHAHARVARHRKRAAQGTCATPPAAPRQRAHSAQRDIARPPRVSGVCARAGPRLLISAESFSLGPKIVGDK